MSISQRLVAAFFCVAGVLHFVIPKRYQATVPDYVPLDPKPAVDISGFAEIAGGVAMIAPATRGFARWWLTGLLIAVFPANVHMAVNPEQVRGLDLERMPRWALWARLPLQPLMIVWVWRATRAR